jgi:hypothetical protein
MAKDGWPPENHRTTHLIDLSHRCGAFRGAKQLVLDVEVWPCPWILFLSPLF